MDYPASLAGNQLTLSKNSTVLIYTLEISGNIFSEWNSISTISDDLKAGFCYNIGVVDDFFRDLK